MTAMDSGFIVALLRNNTIVLHSLADLDKPVQVIEIDPSFAPFGLTYSPYGIAIRDSIRDERMQMSRMLLLGPALSPAGSTSADAAAKRVTSPPPLEAQDSSESLGQAVSPPDLASPPIQEPESGSGLTPPSSPKPFQRQPIAPARSSSLLKTTAPPARGGPFSTAVAETLIVGPNGLQSIAPTPVIIRVEEMCAEGKMDEAIKLVDDERRKGRRGEIDADKTTHQGTMRFLHLLLASHLMTLGMFAKAGDYFGRGKVDPRLLVRVFASLRGKLIGSAEELEVYEGLREILSSMPSVSEIGQSIICLVTLSPHTDTNVQCLARSNTTSARPLLAAPQATMKRKTFGKRSRRRQ